MLDHRTPDGPRWRLLVLDPGADDHDPKWLLATITDADDVRPAAPGADGVDEVTAAWVNARTGAARTLIPLRRALCWRVDGRREDV